MKRVRNVKLVVILLLFKCVAPSHVLQCKIIYKITMKAEKKLLVPIKPMWQSCKSPQEDYLCPIKKLISLSLIAFLNFFILLACNLKQTSYFNQIRIVLAWPWWCRGAVLITTAQLHLTNPELRFCACSNPACRRFAMVRISENGPGWK